MEQRLAWGGVETEGEGLGRWAMAQTHNHTLRRAWTLPQQGLWSKGDPLALWGGGDHPHPHPHTARTRTDTRRKVGRPPTSVPSARSPSRWARGQADVPGSPGGVGVRGFPPYLDAHTQGRARSPKGPGASGLGPLLQAHNTLQQLMHPFWEP